jgi:hypothetical protein
VARYTYSAYGLIFDSDFPCPELPEAHGAIDVRLRYGEVPRVDGVTVLEDGALVLNVDGVADYMVVDGREVVIRPAPGGIEGDVRLWLFGSIFAALLHSRGILPLHASGIETGAGAVLLAGHSGIGKSTLAAAFGRRGFRIVTDDVSGVRLARGGLPEVLPGIARLKLHADTLGALGIDPRGLEPLRPGADKFAYPAHHIQTRRALPLCRVFFIETGEGTTVKVERLGGLDGVRAILEHTFRDWMLDALGVRDRHLEAAARVVAAGGAGLYRVRRPAEGCPPEALMDLLEGYFRAKSAA